MPLISLVAFQFAVGNVMVYSVSFFCLSVNNNILNYIMRAHTDEEIIFIAGKSTPPPREHEKDEITIKITLDGIPYQVKFKKGSDMHWAAYEVTQR